MLKASKAQQAEKTTMCYMLINANRNLVVLGERHHASLEEIDEFLKAARAA
jgi:hypothetical protein